MSNKNASFNFDKAEVKGIVTTVGCNQIFFEDEAKKLGLSIEEMTRLKKTLSLGSRYVAKEGETIVDYCSHSAGILLENLSIDPSTIQGLILVTQSPNYSAPSSAIKLQHLLGLSNNTFAFDIHLGCSGYVYGLSTAYSFIQSGMDRVLLCVGDIATSFVDDNDHALSPLMGDSATATLIERTTSCPSYFNLYSDGSGEKALYIPNSGIVKNVEDGQLMQSKMRMDGAAVFTFTLKRVPKMVDEILSYSGNDVEDIDYFVLHQPNQYILKNLQKRMKISDNRMPIKTQSVYGNQNSGSIPGTINGFLSNEYGNCKNKSLLSGFGIGLSWGACIIETNSIFCPPSFIGLK